MYQPVKLRKSRFIKKYYLSLVMTNKCGKRLREGSNLTAITYLTLG